MELEISDDRMEARLKVIYKKAIHLNWLDKPYFKTLVLRAEKVEDNDCNRYKVDEIKELLSKAKIKFGINISKIFQAILGTDEDGVVIAKGIKMCR